MAHIRSQIRAALAGLFSASVPGTFAAVETARAHRIDMGRLPVLTIAWAAEETQHGANGAAAPVKRRTQWALTVYAAGDDAVADDIDALALAVEAAIGADPTLGGVVAHARVTGSNFQISGETEQRTAAVAIAVETLVVTSAADPETRI